jgi:D-galactarolactone cycloisomerase
MTEPGKKYGREAALSAADSHHIAEVVAHLLTQRLEKPTRTSWGTYEAISIVLIEIRTAGGIAGAGETLARFSPKSYAQLIEPSLKPRLTGLDALGIGALWQSMRCALCGRAGGMLIEAIAGVDIALWDIMGKVAGLPLYRLSGGQGRRSVPVYAASVNWAHDDQADCELQGNRRCPAGLSQICKRHAGRAQGSCLGLEIDWGAVKALRTT